MITLCLDTSALIKRFVEEPGSGEVRKWLGREDLEEVVVSILAGTELMRGVMRRSREGSLSPAQMDELLAGWRTERRALREISLIAGAGIVQEAERLVSVHAVLRASDAVHVATALDLSRTIRGNPVVFVTGDHRQAEVARAEGVEVSLVPA